jgi:hypothetical protein
VAAVKIYYCAISRLYFGSPCSARNALMYGHADVDVSDVLTFADLASHDLGYDLYRIRYEELSTDAYPRRT